MRHLDCGFLEDLKGGCLSGLREMVVSDPSLCLELRGSAVHVYYRGGRLMEVKRKRNSYSFNLNDSYFKDGKRLEFDRDDIAAWLDVTPKLKNAIDLHLGQRAKDEREFQQTLLRENNFGRIARDTDYYICDIEYTPKGGRTRYGQFDLIGVRWHDRRLCFVEMKYGDGALGGKSGVGSHVKNVNRLLADAEKVRSFEDDMVEIFNQKRYLDLVKCDKCLTSFSDDPPLLLLVFANHQPRSSMLAKELLDLPDNSSLDVRVATASFMGYGLYNQAILTLKEAIRTLEEAQARGALGQ